jgi:hypothetical protein
MAPEVCTFSKNEKQEMKRKRFGIELYPPGREETKIAQGGAKRNPGLAWK